jgi:hypothetical protein
MWQEGGNMMIYVLIGILVVGTGVFVWILYSVKKEGGWVEENQAVPITDLNEIHSPHQPGVGQEQIPPEVHKPKTVVDILQNESFATTLVQPVTPRPASPDDSHAAEEVRQLHEEIRLIREKTVIQANNAIEVINKLREENDQLRSDIEPMSNIRKRSPFWVPSSSLCVWPMKNCGPRSRSCRSCPRKGTRVLIR